MFEIGFVFIEFVKDGLDHSNPDAIIAQDRIAQANNFLAWVNRQ